MTKIRYHNVNHVVEHAWLLLLVNHVLTSYVVFVTNFGAIGLDKFGRYVVATSNYTHSVTMANTRPHHTQEHHCINSQCVIACVFKCEVILFLELCLGLFRHACANIFLYFCLLMLF